MAGARGDEESRFCVGSRSRFQFGGCVGADEVEATATRCDSAGAAYGAWTSAGGWGPTGEGVPGRGLTADMRKEDVGAYVPTESPSPPQGAQWANMAPTDRATTEEASVQTSANTCLTGVPKEIATLLANQSIVRCTGRLHAPAVSTAQGTKSHPSQRHA